MSNTLKKRLDKTIYKLGKKTAAISAAIIENDQVIYKNYHGFIDGNHTPNSASKMMMIGSNTKVITAIAIFQLYEQGLVGLDCDIKTYIHNLKVSSRFKNNLITIRDLLMHRSGLISDEYTYFTSTKKQPKDLIELINSIELSNEPGFLYSYSNIGYGLLGYIIEKVSGMDYIDYVKKHILIPLDMGLVFIKTIEERESQHRHFSKSFDIDLNATEESLISIYSAGANVYGTLLDLVKLIQVFINPKDQSVLKEETVKEMMAKPFVEGILDGEMMHGTGLIFNMYNYASDEIGDVIAHGGDTFYHHSRFVFIPKLNAGFIVMTNTINGFEISGVVVNQMMEEYFKYKHIKSQTIKPSYSKRIKEKIDTSLCGTYIGPNLSFTFTESEDGCLFTKLKAFKMKLHKREDGFYEIEPLGLAKLPMFSGYLKRLLFSFSEVNGLKVLSVTEYNKTYYNSAKIGMKYLDISKIDDYKENIGTYSPMTDDNTCFDLISHLHLSIRDYKMIIHINMWDKDIAFYISEVNDKLLVSGYSRHAGDQLKIIDKDTICLFGLTFKKG